MSGLKNEAEEDGAVAMEEEEEEEEDDDLEEELNALFDDDDADSPSGERPLKKAPPPPDADAGEEPSKKRKRRVPEDTAEDRSKLLITQRRMARKGKRMKCDCYVDRATKRAHTHLMALEKAMKRTMLVLPKLAEAKTASVQERIKECRRALKATEKSLRDMHTFVLTVQRVAEGGRERGEGIAMRIACITAKRTDMQVVNKAGAMMRVSDHDDFDVLTTLPPISKLRVAKRRRRKTKT